MGCARVQKEGDRIEKMAGGVNRNSARVVEYRSRFTCKPLPRTTENIRTVTVKQLQDASIGQLHEGRLVLTNSLIYTVRLCGRVIAIDQQENFTKFQLHDGTGQICCQIWYGTYSDKTDLSGGVLGAYYSVVGTVLKADDDLLLRTLQARQVVNYNEITLHMLTAIHEQSALETMQNQGTDRWGAAKEAADKMMKEEMEIQINKEAIVSVLSTSGVRESEDGATADKIIKELHLQSSTVWETLQMMLEEGSIYNTVDYYHFKLADEGTYWQG